MKISIIIVVISFLLSACGGGGPKYGYNHSHSDFNRFMQDRYMCIKETIAYADLSTANSGVRSEPSCPILFSCMAGKGYSANSGNAKFRAPSNAGFYCKY